MKKTKQKITSAAIELFNENGFVNVTLRDIAWRASISTGNLSYHFKNKGAILQAAYERMEVEFNEILAALRVIPTFKNINEQILPFFDFQRKYLFFHVDILELVRAYPELAASHNQQITTFLESIKAMMDYNVGAGNLQAERVPNAYEKLAHTIWMIMTFWPSQQLIRGKESHGQEARDAIWNLIGPYLTEEGRRNYKLLRMEK